MYGIMKLQGGGPPGSGSAQHKDYVAGPSAYKTGSRKGTAAGNKGDKKSQKTTARELNRMIKSGDLDRLVTQGHQDQGYRSGISSPSTVIGGMTKKQQDFINRNRRKDGSLNSAAQVVLDFYSDGRSDYQRDLDKFIKSSPEARDAYLDRFPIGGALNLGIPAAFNALAPAPLKIIGDLAKYAQSGLTNIVPKQIRKDMGPGVQKIWEELKGVPSGFARHGKALLTGKLDQNLDQTQKANLDIIKDEETTAQADLVEGEKTLEDTQDAILEDLVGTETVDAAQDIAYDPRRSIGFIPRTDIEYQPPDILDELDALITDRSAETISTDLDDLLAESRHWPYNYLTNPPESIPDLFYAPSANVEEIRDERANKLAHIERATGHDMSTFSDGRIDSTYIMVRSHEEKGEVWNPETGSFEKKPTAGTIDLTPQEDIFNIGGDQSIDPQDVITQDNIITGFADQPLTQTKEKYTDGTPYYGKTTNDFNVGSFPAMNIFGTEVKGPRSFALDAINTYGNTPSASEKEAFDILNSLGQADGGYLKQYDDGGYANMSTFEKLKAINDSIAEG